MQHPLDGELTVDVVVAGIQYSFRHNRKQRAFTGRKRKTPVRPGRRHYNNAEAFLRLVASPKPVTLKKQCLYLVSAGDESMFTNEIAAWHRVVARKTGRQAVGLIGKELRRRLMRGDALDIDENSDGDVTLLFFGNQTRVLTLATDGRGRVKSAKVVEKTTVGWQNSTYTARAALGKRLRRDTLTGVKRKGDNLVLSFQRRGPYTIDSGDFRVFTGCRC